MCKLLIVVLRPNHKNQAHIWNPAEPRFLCWDPVELKWTWICVSPLWSFTGSNPEVLGFSPPLDPVLPRNLHPEHVVLPNFTSVILPVPSCEYCCWKNKWNSNWNQLNSWTEFLQAYCDIWEVLKLSEGMFSKHYSNG